MLLKGKNNNSRIIVTNAEKWLHQHPTKGSIILITDSHLNSCYPNFLKNIPRIVIPFGEQHKTRETVDYIIQQLLNLSADRQTFLLGFGGGVITDLTGFVASVFMRGIAFGLIPTSLLAQIDASIGGKTGYNFNGYKNIIGSFYLPDFVLCDISFLTTLPQKEYLSGLGELIKYGLIADQELYRFINNNIPEILNRNKAILEYLIPKVMAIKTTIVAEDEHEKGLRKILNFGHTVGHSLEKHQDIPHGFAVNIGMMTALKLSCQINHISSSEIDYFSKLSCQLGLPTQHEIPIEDLVEAMKKDKKKQNSHIDFILLKQIGEAEITTFSYPQIKELLYELR